MKEPLNSRYMRCDSYYHNYQTQRLQTIYLMMIYDIHDIGNKNKKQTVSSSHNPTVIPLYSYCLGLSTYIAGYVHWMIGVVAITGVLITSYIGTQAQAVGIERDYGGIMGRADRLFFIFIANIVNIIYPHEIYSLEALGLVIVIIAITSHITAIQRFFHIWGVDERK
jgi:uncharacterized membrane protein